MNKISKADTAVKHGTAGKNRRAKRDWSMPNHWAQARVIVGGDWRAAVLLHRIMQVWHGTDGKRLRRGGVEFVAMARAEWARSSGLSESETKNYALPILKERCSHFLRFEAWKLRPDQPRKLLWVHVNEEQLDSAFELMPFYDPEEQQPLGGIGFEKGVSEGSNIVPFKATGSPI